jgi:putative ABC transport system permease protein
MFSFPLMEGDPKTALDAPGKIVITRSMERKYFGTQEALGKALLVGGTRSFLVSGVAADPPYTSQIQFDFVASYESLPNANTPNWWVEIYSTYFLLHDNQKDIPFLEKNIPVYMRNQKDLGQVGNDYLTYHLEPIDRVHLYSSLPGLDPNQGDIIYIYILAAIALLILLIASANYTNLATAQAVRRVPEIGIRKVMGSLKGQLFRQFLSESLLVNLFALILAFFLAIMLLPVFNQLVERKLVINMLFTPATFGSILILYLLISTASGAYPAFILSRLKLIKVLKSGFSFSGNSGALRKSLIVFQFSISVFLIISTLIIFQQLSYIRNKNLGFKKDHVVVLPVDELTRGKIQSLKESILQLPGVRSVSCGAEETTNIHWDDELLKMKNDAAPLLVNASPADIDFVRTLGLEIVAGGDFSLSDWKQLESARNNPDPHSSFILNESAVKALGWKPGTAIGKILYRSNQKGVVKAVVKDFHFAPLRNPITPLVIFLDSGYSHIFQLFVKIAGNNIPLTLQEMETDWKTHLTHRPFEYHFLDENYNRLYHTEQQTAKIFSSFSLLAIMLACLGLFALAAYTTIQRAKEIGIRKVLGAGALQIVYLISGDFVKLVAVAFVIAFPAAWLFMNKWLENFAYRIDIGWQVFFIAGISTALIALFSVGYQAIKAAIANPVKSLRTE